MGDVLYSGNAIASRTNRGAQHVYVATAANGGSDANAGTQASPKLTLSGAFAAINAIQDRTIVVHFGAGAFAYSPAPPSVIQRPGVHIILIGDEFAVQATGTVDAGSTSTVVKTTGLVAGAHVGHTIEFLSGAGIGTGATVSVRKSITDNTTTDVRVAVQMRDPNNGNPFVPAAGDTYRIVRPAASFTNSTGYIQQYGGMRVTLINLAIPNWGTGRGQTQHWYGVECSATLHVSDKLYCGVNNEPFGLAAGSTEISQNQGTIASALGVVISHGWHGWGLSNANPTHTSAMVLSPGAMFEGFICSVVAGLIDACPQAEIVLFGGRLASIGGNSGDVSILNDPLQRGAPFLLAPVAVNAPAGGISAIGNMRVLVAGDVEVACNVNCAAISAVDGGEVVIRGTATCTGTTTSHLIACGGAISIASATLSAPNGGGVYAHSGGVAYVGTYVGATAKGSLLQDGAILAARYFTEMGATAGPALAIYGGARLCMQGSGIASTMSCSATAPASAAVLLRQGGELVTGHNTTCTVSNLSSAAGSDGLRAYAGSRVVLAGNPSITTAGSSGYGVNVRGGGSFVCAAQPTGVVGPTADFTVSATAGDDFADTALAVSLSAKVSGMSVVQRSS